MCVPDSLLLLHEHYAYSALSILGIFYGSEMRNFSAVELVKFMLISLREVSRDRMVLPRVQINCLCDGI